MTTEKKEKWNHFSKKEIILCAVSLLLGGVISLFVGLYINNHIPKNEDKIIYENRMEGQNQTSIKKLDYVHSFLHYLDAVEKKDTLVAWGLISNELKKRFENHPSKWLYAYYLTYKYEVKYIIPIKSDHRISEFYVITEFTDFITDNEVSKLKEFITTPLTELKRPIINAEIINCIYNIIDKRFKFDIDSVDYKSSIKEHVEKMSFKDLVIQDWRFPIVIAENLSLPFKSSSTLIYSDLQKHTMFCKVTMLKEDKRWKLQEFHTIAISRWK
jgi:hypothetical protein